MIGSAWKKAYTFRDQLPPDLRAHATLKAASHLDPVAIVNFRNSRRELSFLFIANSDFMQITIVNHVERRVEYMAHRRLS